MDWRYDRENQEARYLGPMAEDLHAAFSLGIDDRHLAPRDVAPADIEGLHEIVQERAVKLAA